MEGALHYPRGVEVLQTHNNGTFGIPYIWWHIYHSNLCGRKLQNSEHTEREQISKTRYSRDKNAIYKMGEEGGDTFLLTW